MQYWRSGWFRNPLGLSRMNQPPKFAVSGSAKRYLHQALLLIHRVHEYLILFIGLTLLGLGGLLWSVVAFLLRHTLSHAQGVRCGRRGASTGFRFYLKILHWGGAARFDLSALDGLRGREPLILVANHPGLLDAPMVLSRLPNVVCVLKASLIDNVLWGAGARLAGYIRNDWFIGSMNLAVDELYKGCQLLLFPEGTRTEALPLGPFKMGPAYISHRSGIPVQTLIIEQDTAFLGKHHSFLKRPDMPMHFRIRLGRCFAAPADPRAFTLLLHDYFLSEIQTNRTEIQQ